MNIYTTGWWPRTSCVRVWARPLKLNEPLTFCWRKWRAPIHTQGKLTVSPMTWTRFNCIRLINGLWVSKYYAWAPKVSYVLSHKPHSVLITNSAAECCLQNQEQKDCHNSIALSVKKVSGIDVMSASLCFLLTATPKFQFLPNRTNLSTRDIAPFKTGSGPYIDLSVVLSFCTHALEFSDNATSLITKDASNVWRKWRRLPYTLVTGRYRPSPQWQHWRTTVNHNRIALCTDWKYWRRNQVQDALPVYGVPA